MLDKVEKYFGGCANTCEKLAISDDVWADYKEQGYLEIKMAYTVEHESDGIFKAKDLVKKYHTGSVFDEIVKFFGSRKQICDVLGVTRQGWYAYEQQGYLPGKRAIEIEDLSEGRFKAKDLIKK